VGVYLDIAFVSHEYLLPDRILELFFELSKGTVKVVETSVKANGPAIKGGCVPPAGGWHVFLPSWYNVYCVKARARYKVAK
jgi:hypothetical protein